MSQVNTDGEAAAPADPGGGKLSPAQRDAAAKAADDRFSKMDFLAEVNKIKPSEWYAVSHTQRLRF